VAVTDLYKRHLATGRDDRHYVAMARGITLASSVIMVGGAYILFKANTMTLQDLWTEFQSIIAGGLVGLYLLGFFTKRGDGRAVGIGIAFAVLFSLFISASGLGWLPAGVTSRLNANFDSYYTGIAGNLVMFVLGYVLALFLPRRDTTLKNLTVWTQDGLPLD
jgi:SSS family solute:Na+ symporter